MAVDTKHKKYTKHTDKVKRVRDFLEGEEKIKEYIIKLPGHEDGSADVSNFRERAYFLPALGRTLDAFVGMVMADGAKTQDVPESFKTFVQDITNDGQPLSSFAGQLVREVLTSARGAIIADYPDREDAVTMTRYDAERLGLRPYAKFYPAEDIINWQTRSVDGRRVTSQVRLMEEYEETGANEWESTVGKQIRVMDLDPESNVYRVRIFRQAASGGAWAQYGPVRYPTMNGKKLGYIPCWIVGPTSLDPNELEAPPLIEIVGVSKAHLNNSASMEWAIMWCGSPTMIFAGEMPKDEEGKPLPIKVGSSAGVVMGEGGTASLLQAGADSVGAISTQMDRKEKHMAAIGARILTDGTVSNVSTETVMMERMGEHSVLSEISLNCSRALTDCMRVILQWGGLSEAEADKCLVELKKEFLPKGMTTGELTEWVKSVQAGIVPLTVLFRKLKASGEVPDEMSEDDYRVELDKDADLFMPDMTEVETGAPANEPQ